MDLETRLAAVTDCQKGFGRIAEANVLHTVQDLDTNSIAASASNMVNQKEIMVNLVSSARTADESSGGSATEGQPTNRSISLPAGSPQQKKTPQAPLHDIVKLQSESFKCQRNMFSKEVVTFWKEMCTVVAVVEKAVTMDLHRGDTAHDYQLVLDRGGAAFSFGSKVLVLKEGSIDSEQVKVVRDPAVPKAIRSPWKLPRPWITPVKCICRSLPPSLAFHVGLRSSVTSLPVLQHSLARHVCVRIASVCSVGLAPVLPYMLV